MISKTPEKVISFATPFSSICASSTSNTRPLDPLRGSKTWVKLKLGISILSMLTSCIELTFAVPMVDSATNAN